MTGSGKIRKFDIDLTSFLLSLIVLCVLSVVLTLQYGSNILFYAGFPFLFLAASITGSHIGLEAFAADQFSKRLSRKKYADAVAVLFACLKSMLLLSGGLFVLAWCVSHLMNNHLTAAVARLFLPAILLMPFIGILKGLLRSIGHMAVSRILTWVMSAGFLLSGLVFGILGYYKGEKVGALLRNDNMRYVYSACGIAAGFDITVGAILVILALLSFASVRRIQRSYRYRQDDLFPTDGNENKAQLFQYCLQRTAMALVLPDFPMIAIFIGSRLWLSSGRVKTNTLASMWGGFAGIGLPVCLGLGIAAAMPFTFLAMQTVRSCQQGKIRAMKLRLSMMLRLSAYVSIPMTAFVFAAAKELVGLFPELTFRAEESAILSLKSGSFLIFLVQTMVLLLIFFWNCKGRRVIFISACASFFACIVTQVLLMVFGVGITMNMWPLDVMAAVFIGFLFLGGQDLLRGLRNDFLMDDLRILLCAGLSAIPLILLNDYLILIMPAAAASVAMLVVYWILYVILSILLRAADLDNIQRVPMGGWIFELGLLLGAAGNEEDDEEE